MQGKRDSFTSRFGIIAAAAGSAIGLGNIWRFPYVLGENGGGAFFLIYLFFIILIGIPLMLTEMTLGRSAQRNAYGTFKFLSTGTGWPLVGIMGVAAAFMILSFYSAVAGWALEYTLQAVENGFAGKTPVELNTMYGDFVSGSFWPVLWMLIFLLLTSTIVVAGVSKGIEKYTKILMPVLLVIIIILDIRAITLPGAGEGLEFLFKPDFSKLTGNAVLEALGQAFFSLSLGMGTIITYGSYINRKERLMSTAASVSFADTLIAVLAGIAIFPAVFAFNIEPDAGPKLVFITLPNIFQQMPGGYFFALLFFVLLVIAALTSSISLLEVIVAYFAEELKISRKKATWMSGIAAGILGVLSALSYGPLKDVTLFGKTAFELLDYVSSNILLPFGGLLITIFAGYILKKGVIKKGVEGESGHERLFKAYYFIIKFLAPVAIAFVFLNSLGILKF
ncbi:sodium-dependent transporter [Prolixibacter sp. SD074]|uniref:sodium-dependent transporter n=1 Tax=Prolixibacter sp. SD074 TaxID=2652391 RepID=UPI001270205F|nr:sodium-dependent transporter [Prolixibacter sp. SD074]GET27879.1 transporter [Prolixibacter sp. SD074]